ncbi:MAG: hypothetical protein HY022_10480 [Chloroflexi bacterium]|nr:hypothetical protein [Chloroflexota bacterium]
MKVGKKVTFLVVAIVAIAVVLFSQGSMRIAAAQASKLKDILNLDPNAQQAKAEVQTDLSNSKKIEQKQADKNVDAIAKVKQLISKAEKEYLTEGWLHMSSSTKAFSTAQQTFPDGSPIPTEWTTETWILLDKHGDAIKAVTIQDTGDPRLMQISVYENGAWTNTSLGMTNEPEKYHPTLDGGLLDTASTYKDIVKFSTEASVVNGQNTFVFTTEENLNTPVSQGNNKQIYGNAVKYYFAESSGLLVQIENYNINSEGALEISQRILMNVTEKVTEPPADILAYFTK